MTGFLYSCSPHIARTIQKSYPALNTSIEVKVIAVGESIPFQYEELGTLKLGGAGLTRKSRCTYDALVILAMNEARKVGGNAIKIVEHTPPGLRSMPQTGTRAGVSVGGGYDWCHSLLVLILRIIEDYK